MEKSLLLYAVHGLCQYYVLNVWFHFAISVQGAPFLLAGSLTYSNIVSWTIQFTLVSV